MKLHSAAGTAVLFWGATVGLLTTASGQAPPEIQRVAAGRFKALTEPPCSYCSTQHRKGLIRGEDRVLAWLRAAHNGGAFPLRHFIAGPRVINDTYGLFFYDPDGGYVAAFRKDYGYKHYGWRKGVMVVQGFRGLARDGGFGGWLCKDLSASLEMTG